MSAQFSTRKIALAGVVAALYAALTIALEPIAYGPVQFRVAEALCILPFFFPFSVWGLFVGCVVANLLSPYPLDIVVGAAASLLAALCTMKIAKLGEDRVSVKALACLPPVVFNAVMVGALIAYSMVGAGEAEAFLPAYIANAAQVGFGQLVVLYAAGFPLLIYLPRSKAFRELVKRYRAVD